MRPRPTSRAVTAEPWLSWCRPLETFTRIGSRSAAPGSTVHALLMNRRAARSGVCRFLVDRQTEGEGGSFAEDALAPDLAAELEHQVLGHRQAVTCRRFSGGRLRRQSHALLEESRLICL